MTYPFSRAIAFLGLLCAMGFVLLWSQGSVPEQVKAPVSATEHRFDIAALNLLPKNPPALDEALKRPLFNPDRKVFVAAPPPQPIVTPPPIEVIEVAPPPPPEPPAPVEPEVFPVEPPVLLTDPAQPPEPPPPAPENPPPPEPVNQTVPVEVAPAQMPAPPPPRIEDAGLQLKGISISGNGKRALLVSPQDGAGKWLKPGELMSSWEVTKIENNQVFLRLGKTVAKLQLYVDKPAN
jgi:outer membrane biosynthesis protein TonB